MIPEHEDFDGTWPFKPHYFDGNGSRMHYAGAYVLCAEGAAEGLAVYFEGPGERAVARARAVLAGQAPEFAGRLLTSGSVKHIDARL